MVYVAVATLVYSVYSGERAHGEQKKAAAEQKKIGLEQKAQGEANAAAERRKQIREERLKRSKMLAITNSAGASGSSGEMGATGSLSTQLQSNIGSNLGNLQTANNISIFSQNSADFTSKANQFQADAQFWGQVSSLATSAGAAYKDYKAGQTPPPTKPVV